LLYKFIILYKFVIILKKIIGIFFNAINVGNGNLMTINIRERMS